MGNTPAIDAALPTGEIGTEARSERAPRNGSARRERGPRGEGRERLPRGQDNAAQAPADFADTAPLASLPDLDLTGSQAPAESPAAEGEERRPRRTRDRYGRDRQRGERGERTEPAQEDQGAPAATLDFNLTDATPADGAQEPARRSYFAPTAAAAAAAVLPAAAEAEPLQAVALAAVSAAPPVAAPAAPVLAPAPVALAPVAPAPVPARAAPAPATPDIGAMPQVEPFVLPVDAMQQVAQGSGLQWVMSDADKVAAVQAAIAAEPSPVRVPRQRPPAVELDDGPLVLVETRRDLRDMQLPFEQPPAA